MNFRTPNNSAKILPAPRKSEMGDAIKNVTRGLAASMVAIALCRSILGVIVPFGASDVGRYSTIRIVIPNATLRIACLTEETAKTRSKNAKWRRFVNFVTPMENAIRNVII